MPLLLCRAVAPFAAAAVKCRFPLAVAVVAAAPFTFFVLHF
jgi:hypothetical protein